MTHLYKLTTELKAVQSLVDTEALTADQVKDTIDALEAEFKDKAEAVVKATRGLDGDIKAIDDEIKRLQALKKSKQNNANYLRGYVLANMQENDISTIECPTFVIGIRKGRESVVIDDVDALPDDCIRTSVKIDPDKTAIKEMIKSGVEVIGAHIERGEPSLSIR